MPKTKASRPATCAHCAGNDLQTRITTYPVRLTGPGRLAGKEIRVGRVALYACQSCGHLMPTPAGQAKVNRCVAQGIRFFLNAGTHSIQRTQARKVRIFRAGGEIREDFSLDECSD